MCERRISTKNGVLKCDVSNNKHPADGSLHHAKDPGNEVECFNKDDTRHTEARPHRATGCMLVNTPLEIDWPSEWSHATTPTRIRTR